MYTEFLQVMAELEHRMHVRTVVVTGAPPAFRVGGDSKALTSHGERGGYDSGLAANPARP
jgi:enoyl-CoA hydratase/carnithine racemase